jgi:small neutral amino acid transporter SnatA (MarC family)
LVAVLAALVVLWMVLIVTARASSKGNSPKGLAQELIPKFMGLLVLAMGVQFSLSGIRDFLAAG